MNQVDNFKKMFLKYFKKYFSVILGLFILAISFNLFFAPTNIAYGGTNGLAIALQNISKGDLQIILILILLVFLVIGFIFLDKKTISKAIIGSILYPLFVIMTTNIDKYIIIDYTHDLLLIYSFGSILIGIGSGLVYKKGFSTGGINLLRQVFYKRFGISMGKSGLILNTIIVLSGAIVINNYTNIMYAVIIIYISNYITDRIILGISEQKAFQIITKKEEEIKEYIAEQLHHKVTIFNVQGGYLNEKENILLCVIPTTEYFIFKEAIKQIDKNAFFVVSDTYEAINEQ